MLLESKKNLSDQGNSKLVVLTSGRPAFRRHVEHAESGDTPLASHMQKVPNAERKKQHRQIADEAAQPSGAATSEKADTRHRRASASSGCSFA